MPRNPSERRALFYEDQSDFNPFIGVDANEYLIEVMAKAYTQATQGCLVLMLPDE